MASSLPFLLEDLRPETAHQNLKPETGHQKLRPETGHQKPRPETGHQNLAPVKKDSSGITYIPEDEPSLYKVVVASNDAGAPRVDKNGNKDVFQEKRIEGVMGDQICPGDLEQCLDACLPVLAILELAHTYCVDECKQRCAP